MTDERSPLDIAADVLVYAPLGLALQLSKDVPSLAKAGREKFQAPLQAARIMGKYAVEQQMNTRPENLVDQLRKMATSYFGHVPANESPSPAPTATPPPRTASTKTSKPAASTKKTSAPSPDSLAIPGYQTLPASQVVAHLAGLRRSDLEAIANYERATRHRKTILARIEQLLAGD
jgi:hypothetical protein